MAFNMQSLGAWSGALAVAAGAFGAHGLKSYHDKIGLSPVERAYYQDVWKTASTYHLIHSAVMAFAPAIAKSGGPSVAPKLFAAGVTLFSGSLYALVLTEEKKFGAVAPVGGMALILGWAALGLRM